MDKQAHVDRPTDAQDIIARLRVEVDDIIDLIRRPPCSGRGVDLDEPQRRCEAGSAAADPSS